MAERRAIESDAIGRKGPPPLPPFLPAAPLTLCVRCSADVARLPPTARFCRRCGLPLPHHLHSAAAAATESPVRPDPVLPMEEQFPPPAILLAYARALFNLGCRYERAVGSRRNLEEAARCYWKAARLGDAAAAGRFDPRALELPILPYRPPPLPPGPALPPPLATVHRPPAA